MIEVSVVTKPMQASIHDLSSIIANYEKVKGLFVEIIIVSK